MNVDFKAKPFFLDESDIAWVQDCMKKMTVEEKVSHLFCILIKDKPVEEMAAEMDALGFYPGGYMTDVFPAGKVKENFKKLQARTGIPLLFASNLERGADGICKEGTLFGTQMQIAAANKYPGFTRHIYLRAYRYNMHLKPKTLLIEAGAQTNTVEEMRNAMEVLADTLDHVLAK